MNKIESGIAELKSILDVDPYPQGFLEQYDPLECLAHSHETETFLVRAKNNGTLYVAKCYDKSAFAVVHESDILARLSHDGLPTYAASFEDERTSVIVREFVDGTPLDRYAKEHTLSDRQIVDFCVQLCDVLSYLHGQDQPVIHRDIKPQNIIVKQDGKIVLIDFETARLYDDGAETDTLFFGTRAYAPPEQYGFAQTDCRTDIYALGVLLRFLLTGSEKEQPNLPASKPLRRVIDRCTAFSPRDRYANAGAVKSALMQTDGARVKRKALAATFVLTALVFACVGFAIGRYTPFLSPTAVAASTAFKEPLIEAAARAQLGKNATEPITAEELKTVRALYIFGTEVSADSEAFADGLGNGGHERFMRGEIASLGDLAMMPNLTEIRIGYQYLEDISGFSALRNLENVNLMHTRVSDATVFAGMETLKELCLYDTNVSDVSCLDACPRLEVLDFGETLVAMDALGGYDTVTYLALKRLRFDTLEGIERYAKLETLNLAGAEIGSLDALGALPSLKRIYADGELYDRLTALYAGGAVEVIRE